MYLKRYSLPPWNLIFRHFFMFFSPKFDTCYETFSTQSKLKVMPKGQINYAYLFCAFLFHSFRTEIILVNYFLWLDFDLKHTFVTENMFLCKDSWTSHWTNSIEWYFIILWQVLYTPNRLRSQVNYRCRSSTAWGF